MKSPKGHRQDDDRVRAHPPSLGFGRLFEELGTMQTESATPNRATRLLVVDDDRHAADAMALMLGLQGYEVAVAYGGAEAVELVERHDPQVVFLDIGMAGMDGFETARRLRLAEPERHHRRLVAVSGYGDEAFVAACREAGFDDHLVKPVNRQMLNDVLEAPG
jgi:CheY-like chemotaxis protein